MSRKVFVTVDRGMTDKPSVCVFPWEVDILRLVHGDQVEEVSIEQMCDLKKPVKVERQKQKHSKVMPPNLREQFEAMAYVDPEEDPANDPVGEYERMGAKYGMDKEFPMPCVERVYGQFTSGAFEAKLKQFAKDSLPRPAHLKDADEEEGVGKATAEMSRDELRVALKERGIPYKATDSQHALAAKLNDAMAPA